MSPKDESVSPSSVSGMMTDSSIPWSHLFAREWTDEWDREGEGVEDVMEGVDEIEVEDRRDIEELALRLNPQLSEDDDSGKFSDDTFLLTVIVLPDSAMITLVFELTRERPCACA